MTQEELRARLPKAHDLAGQLGMPIRDLGLAALLIAMSDVTLEPPPADEGATE